MYKCFKDTSQTSECSQLNNDNAKYSACTELSIHDVIQSVPEWVTANFKDRKGVHEFEVTEDSRFQLQAKKFQNL